MDAIAAGIALILSTSLANPPVPVEVDCSTLTNWASAVVVLKENGISEERVRGAALTANGIPQETLSIIISMAYGKDVSATVLAALVDRLCVERGVTLQKLPTWGQDSAHLN